MKNMKKEYDFTNAEQGKFYRPIEKLELPIYLDKDVRTFFMDKMKTKGFSLNQLINSVLKQDIEITKKLA
jgi:hypothetical protein